MAKKFAAFVGVLLLTSVSLSAGDYFVAVDGDDAASGLSPATAWRTITHALSAVPTGQHTIRVAPGVYDEAHGESYPMSVGGGVSLVGTGGSEHTVLEGGLLVTGSGAERIEGFQLVGGPFGVRTGSLIELRDLEVIGTAGHGIDVQGTGVRIVACELIGNAGSGLYLDAWGGTQPDVAEAFVENTRILDNAEHGVHLWGACFAWLTVDLERCVVERNAGWGLFNEAWVDCGPFFEDPIFTVGLDGTLIARNETGGVEMRPMRLKFQEATVESCTLVDNGGAGISSVGFIDPLPMTDSVLWGNQDDLDVGGSTPIISYCDVEDGDGLGTTGNVSIAPGFVDRFGGDYRLSATSPLRDAGDPARPSGGVDSGGDPRRLDGDQDGATRIDMGFDEFNAVHLAGPSSVAVGGAVSFGLTSPAGWIFVAAFALSTADFAIEPFGSLLLDPSSANVFASGMGSAMFGAGIPADPGLVGTRVYVQALSRAGSVGSFSNRASFRIE